MIQRIRWYRRWLETLFLPDYVCVCWIYSAKDCLPKFSFLVGQVYSVAGQPRCYGISFDTLQRCAPAYQDPIMSLETTAHQECVLLVQDEWRVLGAIQVKGAFWHQKALSVQCVCACPLIFNWQVPLEIYGFISLKAFPTEVLLPPWCSCFFHNSCPSKLRNYRTLIFTSVLLLNISQLLSVVYLQYV